MLAMSGLRAFSLSADRSSCSISCNREGVFVGRVPLLTRGGALGEWFVRPIAQLNHELTNCYRLPVDVTGKAGALALIANAFNRGDLAMAAIAAVQMQFPDPPAPASGDEAADAIRGRAAELNRSSLLKVWNAEEHPRTGVPPNPGWFAPVDSALEPPIRIAGEPFPEEEGESDENHLFEPLGGIRPGHQILQPAPPPPLGLPFPGRLPSLRPPVAAPPKPPTAEGAPPKPWAPPDPKSNLPFTGGVPLNLAPYTPGGKTSGIFQAPNLPNPVELQSGYDGPTASMPPGSPGFNGVTKGHVEGHAAAIMQQLGIMDATLSINNPEICDACTSLLPRMLPPGAILRVILPDGKVEIFRGNEQ